MNKVTIQIKDRINITFAIKIFFMDRPKRTPKLVAIPFPPLNLSKIDQLCPHILAIPKINLSESVDMVVFEILFESNTTGIMPLAISRKSAIIPILKPTTLNALVAPIFPEPTLRRSIFFVTFARIKAKGMDPKR